ncbi:putative histidine kinase response regulator and transcription factor RR-A-type family [Lupinus albus]|uniref:histidine kinase n=1 Tax=Lupinus albus TaxID=3870 RepID=A0A6A4QMJ5_LUPAL|nr:putative histidine kinase response regulator and transcription factor RR-A-type family [Lupinus albus]
MSLNRRFYASNGRLQQQSMKSLKANEPLRGSNSARTCRRKPLLLLMFGLAAIGGVLLSFNSKCLMGKENEAGCEERARILLDHYNVSKKQLHVLASLFSGSDQISSYCIDERRLQMLLSSGIVNTSSQLICPENQELQKEHKCVADTVEPIEQCPLPDDYAPTRLELSFLLKKHVALASNSAPSSNLVNYLLCGMNILQSYKLRVCEIKDLMTSSKLVKGCWWVLIGIIMCCKLSGFCLLWRSQKQKLVKGQSVVQKKKLQLFSRVPSNSAGRWRKKFLVIFVSLGIVGSIWLFWHLNMNIMQRREKLLANMCDERAHMLQDQFNVSMNHVHALAILVSTFHHDKHPSEINQKIFGEYTESTAFERPLTSGVAYAMKVLHSDRMHFENQHGWTIKNMETENEALVQDCIPENLDPAPMQDEYAPVIFAQETVSHIVSIDMMSGKEDRDNILRARASGKGVLTSPFKLLKSNHLGVVLTFAVYNTNLPLYATVEQRIEATVGYLGASYDVPSLVEKLLHQLASKQTIVVNVYDTTNASIPITMYGTDVVDTGLLHISSLDFGDPLRKHEMHCRFEQRPPLPWTAISSSVGVLVITFLLGHIFYAAINRIAKVEDDYREMRELKVRAEAADVAKSQFLATVSHEIRTPMNGVLGMLQMLMDTDLDETQMDYAQTAHRSGNDLISVINEVLDQAKIEARKLQLQAAAFKPHAILDEVLSHFLGKSNEKGIELAVYASNQVPEVVIGDPKRFQQIITNLVGNSLKFTNDKGHVLVSVHLVSEVKNPLDIMDEVLRESLNLDQDISNRTYNTLSGFPVSKRWQSWENFKQLGSLNMDDPEMVQLLVTVEDTGIGIPMDAQRRIFTPFMQADSSTSRTYGGTGIGLSISKCLVDLMGGEIGFVSEPGVGSTFSFTGTFRKGDTTSIDAEWQKCNLFASQCQGLRVLLVDRRKVRAQVTRYYLQRLGMSVDVTSSLKSECSCVSSTCNISMLTQLALILIDKDVWDKENSILFTIKKHAQNGINMDPIKFPKIFLLAAHLSTNERDELKSIGVVDDVLVKPLWFRDLGHYFRESLGTEKRQTHGKKASKLGNLLMHKRILVVDDNSVNRKVAEGVLQRYGAIVTCVESGRAALQMLKLPHHFDVCFMDLQMPEMDGFEVTRQIRSLENEVNEKIAGGKASVEMYGNMAYWHTPILAMTADVTRDSNEECRKCGMDDYVSKPFEEEQLCMAMARFFKPGS